MTKRTAVKRNARRAPKLPMMALPSGKKTPGLMVRSKEMIFTPPVTMGFANLITPDEAFGERKFKLNAHFTPAAAEAFEAVLEKALLGNLMSDIKEQAHEAKFKFKPMAPLGSYLEDKLKPAGEKSRIQLPFIIFKANPFFRNKAGEEVPVTMKGWDAHGAPLDLKGARVGMGSIVKVALMPALWAGPLSKNTIEPSLRLVGIQILKLEQFGGGGQSSVGEVTEADLALCEEHFQPDDLAAFAMGNAATNKRLAQEEAPDGEATDEDDEIPF